MTGTLQGVSNKHCLLSFFFILICLLLPNIRWRGMLHACRAFIGDMSLVA